MSFTDSQGNTYTLNPDAPTLRRIRDQLGVNLVTPSGYAKMRLDPILVADVMEQLCSAQREAFGRSQADFGRDVMRTKTTVTVPCVETDENGDEKPGTKEVSVNAALQAITAVMEDFLDEEALTELLEKKQMPTAELQQTLMLDSLMAKLEEGNPDVIQAAIRGAMG